MNDKQIALVRLRAKFRRVTKGGVIVGANTFKSKTEHISYVSGILTNYLTGVNTGTFEYRNMEGVKKSLTEAEFKEILHSIQELYALAFDRNEELLAAIEAAQDPLSVDLESGWPTVPYQLRMI